MRRQAGRTVMNRMLIGVVVVLNVAASAALSAQENRSRPLPRTASGEPDLQGTWTNETITPFERAAAMADKAFLTEAEVKAIEDRSAQQRATADGPPRPGDVGSYNQAWFDSGTRVVSTRQTSLVVEPSNG